MTAIKIEVKSDDSQFVALDICDPTNVLAEGKTYEETVENAEALGKKPGEYSLVWIGERGKNYIFEKDNKKSTKGNKM